MPVSLEQSVKQGDLTEQAEERCATGRGFWGSDPGSDIPGNWKSLGKSHSSAFQLQEII